VKVVLLLLIGAAVGWFLTERRQRKTHAVSGGLHKEIVLPHTQEFELYQNAFSLCAKKLRVCLAELGIDYKDHHIDLVETGSYEVLTPEFLRVNPGGTVPVLVHNGHPVYESHEQIAYAAEHANTDVKLIPEDPELRKQMQIWVDRSSLTRIEDAVDSAGNCAPGLTLPLFCAMMKYIPVQRTFEGLLFHRMKVRPIMFLLFKLAGMKRFAKLGKPIKILKGSRDTMQTHLEALGEQLKGAGGPWILGGDYSLADVSWVVIFERMDEVDWIDYYFGEGQHPEVAAYWQRLKERPSYQAALVEHIHPLVAKGKQDVIDAKANDPAFRDALLGPA
jgi:glutathione S-transferase